MQHRVILVESNRLMLERLSSVIRNTKDFELVARYQQAGDALGQGGGGGGERQDKGGGDGDGSGSHSVFLLSVK